MRFKEYEIINTEELYDLFKINTFCNGQVVGTKTDKGFIKGISVTTDGTNISEDMSQFQEKKELRGFVLLDYDDNWHKFYQSENRVVVDGDFGNDALCTHLLYCYKRTAKLTVEVDEKIDIDSDDLTIFDGIGQARNDFDTIRDLLKHNCIYDRKYSHSSLPHKVKENIKQRIKLQDAEKEVLNREIIKKDIE